METLIAVSKLIERFLELRLAVSPDTLTMRDSLLIHGPASLPVRLSWLCHSSLMSFRHEFGSHSLSCRMIDVDEN